MIRVETHLRQNRGPYLDFDLDGEVTITDVWGHKYFFYNFCFSFYAENNVCIHYVNPTLQYFVKTC